MKLRMNYKWEVLGFPDIVVVDSHEDDSEKEAWSSGGNDTNY
jgi:hypothetical protein